MTRARPVKGKAQPFLLSAIGISLSWSNQVLTSGGEEEVGEGIFLPRVPVNLKQPPGQQLDIASRVKIVVCRCEYMCERVSICVFTV